MSYARVVRTLYHIAEDGHNDVASMKKNMPDFKKRYGDRAKDVMYATATKMAMKT